MSNFDEWRSNFLISINSNGKFKRAFDECLVYVEQIAIFNKICKFPNETDSFLSATLKPAIDSILSFQVTSENRTELGDITHFLQVVSVLLEWAFFNDKFNLFDILNQITNPEKELYESIKKLYSGKCNNLIEIKRFIIQHEYMTIMLMKIKQNTNLKISHYLFFFQTFNKLSEYMSDELKFSILFGLYEPYQNFLDRLYKTDVGDLKTENLLDLYDNFCTLASTLNLDLFQNCVSKMTFLATNFFLSSQYDYQKLGSSLFKIFSETKKEEKQEFIDRVFLDTLKHSKLVSKILSHKLHSDILPIISPLIDQFNSEKCIGTNDLMTIWKNIVNSPDSDSLNDLLTYILKKLDHSIINDFFLNVQVFPEKVPAINDGDKDGYAKILETFSKATVNLLTTREKIPSETVQIVFSKILNSADQYYQLTKNDPDKFIDMKTIYTIRKDSKNNNSSNSVQIRLELLKVLHERLNKEYNSYVLHLLIEIANSSSLIREDFEERDIKVISKYIVDLSYGDKNANSISSNDDVQYSLYSLYTVLINEYNSRINSVVLESMMKSPSDAFWDFLNQIIEKSNLRNFDEDAIQSLTNFVLKNYMQKSTLFLDFLKLFILNMNVRCGAIKAGSDSSFDDFEINKTPLLYEDEVLIKIILETDDDSILNHTMDILIDIYDNYPDQNEVLTKLLSLFDKVVADRSNNNSRMKLNVITFIFKYCKMKDNSKTVDKISHEKVLKKSLLVKKDGKYTTSFLLPNNETVEFSFNIKPTMHTLYTKIAPFLSSSILNYCICKKSGAPYSLEDKIDFSSFKRIRYFCIKDLRDTSEKDENQSKDNDKKEGDDNKADTDNKVDTNKTGENKDDSEKKKDESEADKDDSDKKKDESEADKDDSEKKKDKSEDDKDDSEKKKDESEADKDDSKKKKKKYELIGGGFYDNYEATASEILFQHRVTTSLFDLINHFESQDESAEETQNKLDELVYNFLMYLPTDPHLIELSSTENDFFPSQLQTFEYKSFLHNKYAIKYLLQVILIRFSCDKYIEMYKEIIPQLLVQIISNDDQSLTLSTFIMNEVLHFIKILHLDSNEFILLLIKMLSLSSLTDNSDECKLEIVNILKSLISNDDLGISDLFCAHFDLFNNVLTSLSNKLWENFKEIVFGIKNPNNLFNIVLKSLIDCSEEDMTNQINRYYTDIFTHFIISISNKIENADEINTIVKVFMKMMKCNPTNTIIDTFEKIANKNSNLLKQEEHLEFSFPKIIEELINIVRQDNKPSMMNKIIELLINLSDNDVKYQQQLNEFADQIASYQIKGWNQMSEADQQNNNDDSDDENNSSFSKKEKGLKNLNQTCYFNSALQQFYHIPAFRYYISNPLVNQNDDKTDEYDEDEIPLIPSLSSLFTEMELSRKSVINPEVFFTIFSSKHLNFELGKQQDAQEFVEYFIDDIKGKAHDLFEWKILTKYQKLDDGQEISSKEETFVSIPLSIESGTMKNSLNEFFSPQKLTGENLYQTSNGTKLESIVTQRIKTAPPVLIFQLKRFAYDKGTHNRVKINKKFEILNSISIKNYFDKSVENNNLNNNYILNGVVVHAGNGSHGHYTSLIKEDIHSDNWIRYDDQSFDRIKTRREFEKLAFGDNDDDDSYGTNGYLLFYVQENATVDVLTKDKGMLHNEQKFILDNSFPTQISQQDELNINNDNINFLFNQCALEKSTLNFMLKCSSNVQLLKYFFGIFVHTKMTDKIKEIKDSLLNSAKITDSSVYLQFITDENNFKNLILPVFSSLSPDKMEKASFQIISKIISTSKDKDLSSQCIQYFIENLKALHKKWPRVCDIGSLIIEFIEEQDKSCTFAVKNGWEKMLLDYIFSVYEEKNLNSRNINISTIFRSLGLIISSSASRDSSCVPLYLKLNTINEKVKDSDSDSNKDNYKELIMACITSQIFSVNDVVEALGEDFPRIDYILHHQLEKSDKDSFTSLFYSLMSVQGFKAEEIIENIADSNGQIIDLLVSNMNLIVDILVFNDPFKASEDLDAAKRLSKMIIQSSKMKLDEEEQTSLFLLMKSEIPRMEKGYQPFFSVLNYLIKSLGIPSSEKIEGLEELFDKSKIEDEMEGKDSNNADMFNMEIYFQPDKITKRMVELLKQTTTEVNDSTFDLIISSIEACENQPIIFAQIVILPEWKSVIQKQSKSHTYTFINKLVAVLNKIHSKILNSIDKKDVIVRFSLVNALSYLYSLIVESLDSGDPRYFNNIPYLEKLVDESFKNSKEIINQNQIESKSEVHSLYIEPQFQIILDFNSYIEVIKNMVNDTRRNEAKDSAMMMYSKYIMKLINHSNIFSQSITDADCDRLKSIKQFIERALSSITMNPDDIIKNNIDNEKDSFVLNLIDVSYAISRCNPDFLKEMNNYIKKNFVKEKSSVMVLLKLKFGSNELISMPTDQCSKEIIQLNSRIKKHKDVFFGLLFDILLESGNHDLIKNVVSSLITNDTQMSDKSFSTIQINKNDASNSVQEKNFFETLLAQFTDNEFDELLHQIHTIYSKNIQEAKNPQFDMMQMATKFLVMLYAKPNKKEDIIKLLPDSKYIEDRPGVVVRMIKDFKQG